MKVQPRTLMLAILLAGVGTPSGTSAPSKADPKDITADQQLLRKAGISLDRDALVAVVSRYRRRSMDLKGVDDLIEKFGDDSFGERERASRCLIEMGEPAYDLLLRATKYADPEIAQRARACRLEIRQRAALRKAAMRVLVKRQSPGTLDALLRSPHPSVRGDCWDQVQEFGFRDKAAQQVALQSLADDDPLVARSAMNVLFGRLCFDPLPATIRLAESPAPRLRAAAMFLLRKFAPEPRALSVLFSGLKDEDIRVRRDAVSSMGCFAKEPQVVKTLCALLDDPDPGQKNVFSIAEHAADGLAQVGDETEQAIAALGKASRIGKRSLQERAFISLGSIGGRNPSRVKQVLPHLVRGLESLIPEVRWSAAAGCLCLRGHGESAVKPLIAAFEASGGNKTEIKYVKLNVLSALQHFGPAAEAAVLMLTRVLEKETDRDVLRSAVQVLGEIGPAAKTAIPSLQRLSKERESLVGLAAKAALKNVGP